MPFLAPSPISKPTSPGCASALRQVRQPLHRCAVRGNPVSSCPPTSRIETRESVMARVVALVVRGRGFFVRVHGSQCLACH
jgi:hypothetical protein